MKNLVLFIQENHALLRIYRIAASLLQLTPYYIMEEFYTDGNNQNEKIEKEDYMVVFLTHDDMEKLGKHEESNLTTEQFIRFLDAGCLCLALKCKDEIAAYSWCNLNNLSYKNRKIPLNNEAALFNARTYKKFRGKNLAPYLRNELCRRLKEKGIERFYSISLWSNTASIKFKKKSGAKPVGLFLYIGLFRKYHYHVRLRKIGGEINARFA